MDTVERQASATNLSPKAVREGQKILWEWMDSEEHRTDLLVARLVAAVTEVQARAEQR